MYEIELYHHGVKGMKWGVRRYQNADGSLTDAGRKRYINQYSGDFTKKGKKRLAEVGEDSIEGKHLRREKLNADFSKNWVKTYNKASDEFNSKINALHYKLEKQMGDKANTDNKDYLKAVGKLWTDIYSKTLIGDFGPDPVTNGRDWVKNAPFFSSYDDMISELD